MKLRLDCISDEMEESKTKSGTVSVRRKVVLKAIKQFFRGINRGDRIYQSDATRLHRT